MNIAGILFGLLTIGWGMIREKGKSIEYSTVLLGFSILVMSLAQYMKGQIMGDVFIITGVIGFGIAIYMSIRELNKNSKSSDGDNSEKV